MSCGSSTTSTSASRPASIGAVGDARITKPGLIGLKTRVDGIMGPLKRAATIDDYTIDIPVLNILSIPESSWTADRAERW